MKIKNKSIVFYGHSSNIGGAELSLFEIINFIKLKTEYKPIVILPDSKGLIFDKYLKSKINVKILDTPWMKLESSNNIGEHRNSLEINKGEILNTHYMTVKAINPVLIFSQTSVHAWGAIVSAMLGVRHFWNIREFGKADHGLVDMFPFLLSSKNIVALSDEVYFSSKYLGKEFMSQHKDVSWKPLYSVPDLRYQKSVINIKNIRRKIYVGFFGTFTESKNPLLLLEAIKILAQEKVNVETDFYGIGPLEERMMDYVNENNLSKKVKIIGHKAEPEKYFNKYDAVISCAESEAFGRSLSEGALYGCVPIYPNIPSWRERFTPDLDSLEYRLNDAVDLAQAIKKLMNRNLRKKLEKNVHKLAANKFNCVEPGEQVISDLENSLSRNFKKKNLSDEIKSWVNQTGANV